MKRQNRILKHQEFDEIIKSSPYVKSQNFVIYYRTNMEDFTRPWIEKSSYSDRIKMYIGDAMVYIPQLNIQFDLAFIDGDKRRYLDYYEMTLKYLVSGGYILVDNTLWDGHVVDSSYRNDPQTKGIMDFNDRVAADERVEKVIFPLRDGLTLIRKK